MNSDFDLLGIPETRDVSKIKSAYRRIVKAVHPDVAAASDSFRNHLMFIQVTKAYERLLGRLSGDARRPADASRAPSAGSPSPGGAFGERPSAGRSSAEHPSAGRSYAGQSWSGRSSAGHPTAGRSMAPGSGVVPHKDPAYVYYKTAMNFFRRIHPSAWRIDVKHAMAQPSPAREREFARIQQKTKLLVALFPKAYYYFSIVVHEYPESVWTQDARDKMQKIEDRTKLYERIIRSFTEHAREVPRVNRMF